MKLLSIAGLIAGLMLLTVLLTWYGVWEIILLLLTTGWVLLWLPVVWLPSIIPTTEAWRLLFAVERKPGFLPAIAAMWMGRAINNLLPVATIGGEIVKARLITLWGSGGIDAAASVVVDKTVQVFALIVWGLAGVGLLSYLTLAQDLAVAALAGFGALAAGVTGFILVQKAGLFNLLVQFGARLVKSDFWDGITTNARAVDKTVVDIYRNQSRFALSVILKALGLLLQAAEVWLACYLLGHPLSLAEALMLKSLTTTLSDIAFVIPNAYGIQEGAFIVIGAIIGLGPDLALAVSLALRVREVLIDLPGLMLWQALESRLLLERITPD